MRVPQFDGQAVWLQGLGLFVLGAVTGAVAFMVVSQANYNYIAAQNTKLLNENKRLAEDLENIKNQTSRQTVVTSVIAHVETKTDSALDQMVRDELKRKIETDLKVFKGKPVHLLADPKYFDYEIVRRLLHKPYAAGQSQYVVELKALAVIRSDVRVWVRAEPFVPEAERGE